jgi:hypothetical protein
LYPPISNVNPQYLTVSGHTKKAPADSAEAKPTGALGTTECYWQLSQESSSIGSVGTW